MHPEDAALPLHQIRDCTSSDAIMDSSHRVQPEEDKACRDAQLESGSDEQGFDPTTTFQEKYLNKGSVSNLVTFSVMIVGFILRAVTDDDSASGEFARFVLFAGLFGFAGGITNWLAVKMLFDEIPLIYGSGVIPRRFKEIRSTVKYTIMNTFFDLDNLDRYMKQKLEALDLASKVKTYVESEEGDKVLTEKLTEAIQGNQQREWQILQASADGTAVSMLMGMVMMMNPALARTQYSVQLTRCELCSRARSIRNYELRQARCDSPYG